MVKPYNWKEIKNLLEAELKKTKNIMTFGTIGSCNVEHDIDIIITKTPGSSLKEFFMEIHYLFDNLDEHLVKKYDAHAIRFSTSEEQFSILELMKNNENNLAFHTMVYINYPEMKRDWDWSLFEDVKL